MCKLKQIQLYVNTIKHHVNIKQIITTIVGASITYWYACVPLCACDAYISTMMELCTSWSYSAALI